MRGGSLKKRKLQNFIIGYGYPQDLSVPTQHTTSRALCDGLKSDKISDILNAISTSG